MIKKTVLISFAFLFLSLPVLAAAAAAQIKSSPQHIEPGWYFEYKTSTQKDHILLKGTSPKEQFGSSLAKGDLNGDGISDVAIGSPFYSSGDKKLQGKASVFFGSKNINPTQETAQTPAITILGENKNHYLGTAVAFGDFNADGIDDLAIGSMNADKIYMFLGKTTEFPAVIDLSKDLADITFRTASLNENFGFSLDMADINSDGIQDLVIGAPSASSIGKNKNGKLYVVFGYKYPSPQFLYDFSKIPPSIIIWGENTLDQFGASLAHGDINGDKRTDIIAGAYLSGQKPKTQTGKVYVFFGKHPDDLSPYVQKPVEIKVPDITLEGANARNWFGYSVSGGDVNNDGLSDIAAGAFMYQSASRTGKAYIYYGKKSDYRITAKILGAENLTVAGNQKYEDIAGASVIIGDVNNDGKNDFIVGAPGIGEQNSSSPGHVYIFENQTISKPGYIDTTEKTPTALMEGLRENDWFGSNILIADFNGDKNNDLIISAPNAYNSGKNEGAVYIILGKPEWPGAYRYKAPASEEILTRGQFIYDIFIELGLDSANAEFLRRCEANPEFCLFDFAKKTLFRGIKFSPKIQIYPDVSPENIFYKEITSAAMLKIMQGFADEAYSPFKPDEPIARIHALKVLLEASGMMSWKNHDELKKELKGEQGIYAQKTPYADISAKDPGAWWYPRYVNYAYLSGIISDREFFRPMESVKQSEIEEWTKAVKRIIE